MRTEIFHIVKASRSYSGVGYAGPSCQVAGVPAGKDYTNLAEAFADSRKLTEVNLVGFDVYSKERLRKIPPVIVPAGAVLCKVCLGDGKSPHGDRPCGCCNGAGHITEEQARIKKQISADIAGRLV